MLRLFILCLIFSLPSLATEETNSFLEGVKAYQAKDFSKAQKTFNSILAEHPENPALLYNLGLTEYQLGNFGMALGLWRKARFLDQSFTEIQRAIEFTEESLFPNRGDTPFFATIYQWLMKLPLYFWALLSLFSFTYGGWLALEYGIKRRFRLNLWPLFFYFSIPIFIFSSFFALSQFIDQTTTHATIIQKDLLTHTNPSTTSPTLSELTEGEVVTVEKVHGEWVQVRTRQGTPGWVPQTALIAFKGSTP